jgi:hypothetical protein
MFILYITSRYSHFNILFSSSCQRQCELLPSLGVRRPLTFHILIFSSKTTWPNRWFLPSFGSFGPAVSEEKNFFKLTNQKQELPVAAMLVNGSGRNVQSL